jgi:hypothetical protein
VARVVDAIGEHRCQVLDPDRLETHLTTAGR